VGAGASLACATPLVTAASATAAATDSATWRLKTLGMM